MLEKQKLLTNAEAEVTALEKLATETVQKEQTLAQTLKAQRDLHTIKQRELSVLEAELGSLVKIQQTMKNGNNEAALSTWLKNAGLENNARIWQGISIKKGWETALEAALGAKLNAITTAQLNVESRSPSALTLAIATASTLNDTVQHKNALYALIEKIEPSQQAVLQDWLTGAQWLEEGVDVHSACQKLAIGEYLVCLLYTSRCV